LQRLLHADVTVIRPPHGGVEKKESQRCQPGTLVFLLARP
jgi:hypothetical protein